MENQYLNHLEETNLYDEPSEDALLRTVKSTNNK